MQCLRAGRRWAMVRCAGVLPLPCLCLLRNVGTFKRANVSVASLCELLLLSQAEIGHHRKVRTFKPSNACTLNRQPLAYEQAVRGGFGGGHYFALCEVGEVGPFGGLACLFAGDGEKARRQRF